MGRRRKSSVQVVEGLEITACGAEGHSIGRNNNQVVFVKYAAPGDVVDVRVSKKKKNFLQGEILRFEKISDLRIEPFCPDFGSCGGCKWQHLPYKEQLKFKQQQVIDALQRLGNITDYVLHPIADSPLTQEYRNKLELTFADRAWELEFDKENPQPIRPALGFHMPGQFSKLLDIEHCYLMPSAVNIMQRQIKNYCIENNLTFHNIQRHEGLMRNIMFRVNKKGEWMIVVSFYERNELAISGLMTFINSTFPEVVSLNYTVNSKANDSWQGCEVENFSGTPYLTEELGDLTFQIQPLSFFQTNTQQTQNLYDLALNYAEICKDDLVYDLYTGTGTIALYMAKNAKKVVGIEYVQAAIDDAWVNAKNNNITNCDFYAGDMKDVLTNDFVETHGKPDVIVTDPPREGMHPSVVECILNAGPKRIVYVSCNPATQARDLALLSEKYDVTDIQPVDMFPHTHHVENIAVLKLK
jgi:23S rRNA (uracil1939-C5)-methyltransferase